MFKESVRVCLISDLMQGIDFRDLVLDIDLDCHVCDTCLNNRVPVLSNDLMQGIDI